MLIGSPAPLLDVSHGGIFFMSNPIKNPTTYKQQLDKLKLRGCITKNDAFCMSVLKAVNYYRLSVYFLPLKTTMIPMLKEGITSAAEIWLPR